MADVILIDQVFLKKLTKILENNYSNEHFGVKELAKKIPLNRSQLHRKLHAIKGVSASQFIREYRLQKAYKLLQSDVATASEISYQVGFNSPTYFNTTFHEYYGYPPGEVKYQKPIVNIKSEDIDIIENKISPSKTEIVNQTESKLSKGIIYKMSFSVMILVVFISIYIYSGFSNDIILSSEKISNKSIAVLPFDDMSSESNSQWFSDGVVEDIISNLSKIKDLRVISRTSSKRYKNTDKTIPKIAKELSVSYVVEGSIRKEGNSVLITAKLINANEEHIWTENYNGELDDIFKIQREVAQEIVNQLKIKLTPKEDKTFKEFPTKNMEAYHLFLKGRLINHSRKKEDLERNIKLNKKAIALDSNFAEAYAELGNSYFLMSGRGYLNYEDGRNKTKFYIDKALQINPNTFRANAVKAMILWGEDWGNAKKYHEKAIALNPNDAAAHLQYGRYFLFIPKIDIKKFLSHLTKAQQIDPFSTVVGGNYLNALFINDKIEEAEQYLNKMGFLWSKETVLRRRAEIQAHKNKDWTEAIRFYKDEIDKDPNNSFLYRKLGQAYDEILNDDINFIKYSKKAYILDSTNNLNAIIYSWALVEGKKFAAAKKLMQSNNFKSQLSKKQKSIILFYYYYHQENYKKAQEVFGDSLMANPHYSFFKAISYAQSGDRKKIDSLLKSGRWRNSSKAFIFAILKEKDSMYHYLEQITKTQDYFGPNSRREFDPYRKEKHYKELLKKNYLPLTHWNE